MPDDTTGPSDTFGASLSNTGGTSRATSSGTDLAKARQRTIRLYQRVFSSDEGREVLADLEQRFGLTAAVFVPVKKDNHHAYDPLTAALSDGARRVIIHIRAFLAAPSVGDGNVTQPRTVVKR